jgi:hypothetical protein
VRLEHRRADTVEVEAHWPPVTEVEALRLKGLPAVMIAIHDGIEVFHQRRTSLEPCFRCGAAECQGQDEGSFAL